MEPAPHLPDEGQGPLENLELLVGKISVVFQVPGLFQVEPDPGKPHHGMVIPKPPLPVLEVRLQQVGGIPESTVALPGRFRQPFGDFAGAPENDLIPDLATISEYSGDMPQTKRASRRDMSTS